MTEYERIRQLFEDEMNKEKHCCTTHLTEEDELNEMNALLERIDHFRQSETILEDSYRDDKSVELDKLIDRIKKHGG